ncbi:MAG: hypothetical protein JJU11_05765 [Candidatus Sumerlaeia bacterium]|nr:hypothetical protein [Candidatus Sumerlaeia bacterium]
MPEASSRILVDRSVVRLDGRPFFTFGTRLYLTPQDRLREALATMIAAGFNSVGSPPCSPGTLPLLHDFFDATEATNLMAVLMTDQRLPEHGRYLAENFSHRSSLHSYVLSPRSPDKNGLNSFLRERDTLRTKDLFHPISIPINARHTDPAWFQAQDIHTISSPPRQIVNRRIIQPRPAMEIGRLRETMPANAPHRPILATDVPVGIGDEERLLGLYDDDPWVKRFPARSTEWFPWLANLIRMPRRDFLGPDPEILRLQVYELLTMGVRGIMLDFYEMFGGQAPYTGRDRFLEAAQLAQEINVFQDFFAEGQLTTHSIETGHPRLGASMIRHGHDSLILLRMDGYEEDFFVDEAYMERTEISIAHEGGEDLHAWRMDFPMARKLDIHKDSVGTLRFLAGPLELTGLILLTPGSKRPQELADEIAGRLPFVARLALQQLEVRHAKISLIEGELRALGAGIDNSERLNSVYKILRDARNALDANDFATCHEMSRAGTRRIRQLVKYQVARALASPYHEKSELLSCLRMNYHTLPRFYRDGAQETARAFTDLT